MNQLRVPFVIHWGGTPKPDLSGFIEPVRVPFRFVRRKPDASTWSEAVQGRLGFFKGERRYDGIEARTSDRWDPALHPTIVVRQNASRSLIPSAADGPPGANDFVPCSELPTNARPILRERTLMPNGSVAVTIPEGFISEPATNGQGLVFRAPGTTGDADTIRLMMPNRFNPTMYLRYYNGGGQPISPFSGRTGRNEKTHFTFGGAIINPGPP